MRRMMLTWQLIAHGWLFSLDSRISDDALLLRNETNTVKNHGQSQRCRLALACGRVTEDNQKQVEA